MGGQGEVEVSVGVSGAEAECFLGATLVGTFLTLHQERSLVGGLGDTVQAHCP